MRTHFLVLVVVLLVFSCDQQEQDRDLGPVPASPIDLAVNNITKSTIELSWTDNSTNEEGFIIERKTFEGFFTEIAQTDAEQSLFTDTQLTPRTQYSYRVLAFNAGGKSESYTNVVTIVTLKESISFNLQTLSVNHIGSESAFTGGTLDSNGFPDVITMGVVWSTNPSPIVSAATKTIDTGEASGGKVEYESVITGLLEGTKYYVRAYVTNAEGTVYGEEFDFVTSPPLFSAGDGVTDIEGHYYKTVLVGDQEWMAENLRTSKYVDGTWINANSDPFVNWGTDMDGAWLYPGNLETNDALLGKFYDWYAVTNPALVCPNDWHVPTLVEWYELIDMVGGDQVAGMRLKEDTDEWEPSIGTNESGIEALPAGNGWQNPTSAKTTLFWTSNSQAVNADISVMYLSENQNGIQVQSSGPKSALYIRCLKDHQ